MAAIPSTTNIRIFKLIFVCAMLKELTKISDIKNSESMEKVYNVMQYTDRTNLEQGNDLSLIAEKSLVKFGVEIPKPESIIAVCQTGHNDIDVFTKGSISTIIGKAKSGKTALTSILVTACLNGQVNGEFTKVKSNGRGKVIVFDTEQGEYYASLNVSRIGNLAPDMIDNLQYHDLRPYNPTVRFDAIKHVLESTECDIDLVIIDGVRDILYDINSSEEAITIVSKLMELSVTYNTHISVVLHQNKGDSNARGHIGTECVNKSEVVISVERDTKGEASIITPEYSRGIEFKPFLIKRNEHGVPYIDGGIVNRSADKKKRSFEYHDIDVFIHHEILGNVFTLGQSFGYTDLWRSIKAELIKKGYSIGDSRAKDFLKIYQSEGLIEKRSRDYFLVESGLIPQSV